jgi:hypothetical protein
MQSVYTLRTEAKGREDDHRHGMDGVDLNRDNHNPGFMATRNIIYTLNDNQAGENRNRCIGL